MAVCQYFLQGRCRFGQNCRNVHVYDNSGRGGKNTGNNQQNNTTWQISNDVIAAEKGGQWPLSCFAPVKGASLPGWEDISPEEVRWTLYEAQKNGTVNQALNQINEWYKNAEKARNLLKHPTNEIINLLNDLKNKKNQSNVTSNPFTSTSTPDPKSTFRFDTAVTNIFGKPVGPGPNAGSPFDTSNSTFQSQSIFGGGATQSSPNPSSSIFSTPQNSNQNIFSSANVNVFSNNSNSLFQNTNDNRNIFQAQQPYATSNVFGNSAPVFGGSFTGGANVFGGNTQNNQFQPQITHSVRGEPWESQPIKLDVNNEQSPAKDVDSSIYSNIEDLTQEEIKAFTSTTFTFGKIPLKPPLKEYC